MQQELKDLLPALRRFAYSLTGSMADADDLLQNTVERILTRDMPSDVDLTKWAFRICRNVWIDECRARKVRRDATENPELSDGQVTDGEHQTTKEIEWSRVDAAMSRLPEDQRQIISLVAIQGMPYKMVAEILEVPKGTVMSRLARARAALSEALSPATLRSES
ncbi:MULTISPECIES: RNA polymerase sigma factor [Marinobacter]|jgi:RNA polymerase sigma-70 factor (ECF subfamily)|uniref:DNA-directed RNA polymerase sigma-70 factor n=2 Tax=Marinobacter TaxID=2742 RepID=A0A5M3PYC3_9GAMM|nr:MULTISPECIES: RNA polymerase sigma factor [Marinobacter]MBY6069824.1 RNA polymerase sigma factor [Marinobacter salsuginis]ODM29668.1 RNA polymerase subunit sigma-70 [Marinobacter adhaerens]QTN41113.1 RNA polymerase sigma factor [Marinobacter salsuginis]GBO85716.1 DNA-directed RNA polymerase sigma-70 factor [Marinobacter salsuginis]GBO87781.1 DNA-directed RNA polymerase sigma-70 factor [Marinobacter salsuginis]|tara:strand:+ start:664 stop:1155 length:492 start_codon:yes stop_codon:yes gene_type:complete